MEVEKVRLRPKCALVSFPDQAVDVYRSIVKEVVASLILVETMLHELAREDHVNRQQGHSTCLKADSI